MCFHKYLASPRPSPNPKHFKLYIFKPSPLKYSILPPLLVFSEAWPRLASPGLAWLRLASPGSAWPRLVPPGLAWPRLASKDPRQSGLGIFPKLVTIFSQGILMSFYICKIIFLLNFDPCPFFATKIPLWCSLASKSPLWCSWPRLSAPGM